MNALIQLLTSVWILIVLIGCGSNHVTSSFEGVYGAVDFVNNYDTITFDKSGIYNRIVRDSEGNIVRRIKGIWFLRGRELSMPHFYLNLDDNLKEFPESAMDDSTHMTRQVFNINGQLGFCVGYFAGEYCYRRVSETPETGASL